MLLRLLKASFLLLALSPLWAYGQGLPIKDGNSSVLAEVNAAGSVEMVMTKSTKATYTCSSGLLVTTAAFNLSIEAPAASTITLNQFCVGWTSATAAAGISIAVNRRSTASSGGTALTMEGTGADACGKHDFNDGNYTGTARRTATLGTIGPTLFQTGRMVGEIGAGTADVEGGGPFCYDITNGGQHKGFTIASGTTSGISITVTAPGAGGLAFGSISATFTVP